MALPKVVDYSKIEEQAHNHLDAFHAVAGQKYYIPVPEHRDRTPVEELAHLRRDRICTHPKGEIYS